MKNWDPITLVYTYYGCLFPIMIIAGSLGACGVDWYGMGCSGWWFGIMVLWVIIGIARKRSTGKGFFE